MIFYARFGTDNICIHYPSNHAFVKVFDGVVECYMKHFKLSHVVIELFGDGSSACIIDNDDVVVSHYITAVAHRRFEKDPVPITG